MKKALEALKQKLYTEISLAPISGSLPLYLNGILTGNLHPRAIEATQHYPFFRFESDKVYIDLPLDTDFNEKSQFFNQLALHFRQFGCLPYWRDEQVCVWRNQQVFAHIERTATRPLGFMTQAMHMNAWHQNGKIFLSLRAPTKQTDPNKWDTIAGGLLNAQDTPDAGLERETYEEAGVEAWAIKHRSPIRSIDFVRRPLHEGYQFEEVLTSDCILPPEVSPQNVDGEVSRIETFSIDEVIQLMQAGMVTTEAMVVLIDSLERDMFKQLSP